MYNYKESVTTRGSMNLTPDVDKILPSWSLPNQIMLYRRDRNEGFTDLNDKIEIIFISRDRNEGFTDTYCS